MEAIKDAFPIEFGDEYMVRSLQNFKFYCSIIFKFQVPWLSIAVFQIHAYQNVEKYTQLKQYMFLKKMNIGFVSVSNMFSLSSYALCYREAVKWG